MKPANVKTDPFVPDPLIPFNDPYTHAPVGAPFDVPAGSNQPIWVDIYILKNTPACSFQGTFIVTSNGVSVAAIPVTIITYGINIPDSGSGPKTPFKISFGNLPSFHKGATFNVNSPYTQLLVRRYEDFSHAHRVNTRFNPFTVLVGYGTDGCAPPTQANLQAWAQSVAGYFDGSYFSDGVPVNSFYTDFNPGGGWGLDSCSAAQIQDIAAVWAAFLKKQGWFHKAIAATADEPSYSASDLSSLKSIAAHAQAMVQGDADWLAQIMVTTPASSLSAPVLGSSVGVYCTYLTAFDTWWHQNVSPNPLYYGRKEWPSFRAGPPAHSMWFYECSGMGKPYPTFSTNTLLATEPMIMFWASYFENATGFLYWDMAYWNLTSSWGPNTLFPKLGDGVLLYPGAHDGTAGANAGSPAGVNIAGPIGSIRLKMIRQGLQDWSLFSFASQSGLDSFTRKAVSEIYGNLGACNWDGCLPPPINKTYYWDYSNYTHIEDVRRRVFQALKDLSPSPLAQAASSSTTSTLVTSSTSKTLSTSTTTAFLAVTTTAASWSSWLY
ncbi:hypothetical protein BC830DRAFT_1079593 [Chytriomyces sp. MP71]|nr:hypothetical protein BC830DRAFT_1079593 [Chytriomyces sp. MP71]